MLTEKGIISGNKLIIESEHHCTEFTEGGKPMPQSKSKSMRKGFFIESLKFHESWNALMPVVESIQNNDGCRFMLDCNEERTLVRFTDMGIPGKAIVEIKDYSTAKTIDVVWQAVVEYLRKNGGAKTPAITNKKKLDEWFNEQGFDVVEKITGLKLWGLSEDAHLFWNKLNEDEKRLNYELYK